MSNVSPLGAQPRLGQAGTAGEWDAASDEVVAIALALGRPEAMTVARSRYATLADDFAKRLVDDPAAARAVVEGAFDDLMGRCERRGRTLRAAVLVAVHRRARPGGRLS